MSKFGSASFETMMKCNFLLTAIVSSVLLAACLPQPVYPDEPAIEFLTFSLDSTGSAVLALHFTDGDGDLGLDQTDTLPPFCATCDHHFNLRCEYDELRDGIWTHIELNPLEGQVPFYYRIPRVEPTGTNPALSGVIEIDMNTWSLQSDYDTLRFRMVLEDRALNLSNEDTTHVIVK